MIAVVIARGGTIKPERFQIELAGHAAYLQAKAHQYAETEPQHAVLMRAATELAQEIEAVPFELTRRHQ